MTTSNYYGNVNLELLRWLPLSAGRVLELGCGEGALAAAYRLRNPGCEYVAVEVHAPAAAIARGRVDRLLDRDFGAMSDAELDALGEFDLIVMGDVLEHLADPWRTLHALRGRLRADGRLVVSVPNISHWSGLAHLLSGRWPAEDSGLFDRTHLRFFTLDSLTRTMNDAHLTVERWRPRLIVGNRTAAEQWIPLLADAAERAGLDRQAFLQRSQTLQYVASAHRADHHPPPRLHVHCAALAPKLLDIRARVPAEALDSDPNLAVSYEEGAVKPPALPNQAPKVLILQRLSMQDEAQWLRFINARRAAGWILVFEIDDHPELLARVHRDPARVAFIERVARGCHAIQTSTAPLADALRTLNPEVAVFENTVLELPPFRPRDEVRRVFYGALNREGFSAQVAAALQPALADGPELEFVVVHDRAFFDALPTARKAFKPVLSYEDFLAEMQSADVVLSPLEGAFAEQFKSDVKFVEAASRGAAMIASRPVYERTIVDGGTGLIAETLEAWPTALARLAGDPALRNQIAEAAWTYVRDHRMLGRQVSQRAAWYRSLVARRDELDAALVQRLPALVG